MPVPVIWLSAPSNSQGQNEAVGHGTASPVATITTPKKMIENGKPNRKRILVAPQGPSGPVRLRCIALRATCPSAAMMVKGIQSVVVLNIGGISLTCGKWPHRDGRGGRGQSERRMTGLRDSPSPRKERGESWGEGQPRAKCACLTRISRYPPTPVASAMQSDPSPPAGGGFRGLAFR